MYDTRREHDRLRRGVWERDRERQPRENERERERLRLRERERERGKLRPRCVGISAVLELVLALALALVYHLQELKLTKREGDNLLLQLRQVLPSARRSISSKCW